MKRPRIVKDSGPYQVRYQDEYHCCIEVYLPVGKYGKTKLLDALERWLNAPYEEETK